MLPQVASNLDSATGTRIYIFFFLLLLVFSSFLVVLFAWNFNIYFYFCQGSGFLVWHIGLLFICGIVKSVKGFSFQFSVFNSTFILIFHRRSGLLWLFLYEIRTASMIILDSQIMSLLCMNF